MAPEQQIIELLAAWEDAQARGENPSPESLCAQCPHLTEPLRERIRILQAMAPVLDLMPFHSEIALPSAVTDANPALETASTPPAIAGYEILGELGRGGTGVIFKARQSALDRLVAIKVILVGRSKDSVALARFDAEAKTVARLEHPNIVRIHDSGVHDDCPFLVLEYMEDGNLGHFLSGHRLSVNQAASLIELLARTIHYAHEQGIVHRDLKPTNILLKGARLSADNDIDLGTPKIGDFGLALQVHAHQRLTLTGTVMGTPNYMAPEQAAGRNDLVGPATDVYGLGVILYELLTGVVPFEGNTQWEVLHQVVNEAPRPPSQRRTDCPPALEAICMRCLHKHTGGRYPSARALADDLGRYFAGKPLVDIALTPTTLKLGVVLSLTGPPAINSEPLVDMTRWAIDELNGRGGLLGRMIVPVIVDCRFDEEVFAREAERLIVEEHVSTLLGTWSSANRKALLRVVEKHRHLLLYPVEFEGLERSDHVVYLGAVPNQLVFPSLRWLHDELGKRRFFLVGSDSVFSRATSEIVKDALLGMPGAECVAEEYVEPTPAWYSGLAAKLKSTEPDVIFNVISGDSNIPFFRTLKAAGITPQSIPVLSLDFTEQELRSLDLNTMAGHYLASSYFQSLDSPENHSFLERFFATFGRHRVVTDAMEATFAGVHLWAQAVQKAGADDPQAIRAALLGQSWVGPGGTVRIDPESGYAHKFGRIGRIELDGSLRVIWSSPEPIAPVPYPESRPVEAWEQFLEQLYRSWGGHWARRQV